MHSLNSRDVGVSVSCQKWGQTAAPKTKAKGRALPRLTCPSSYCFVSQPFLKFSRSGYKKGERQSEGREEMSYQQRLDKTQHSNKRDQQQLN